MVILNTLVTSCFTIYSYLEYKTNDTINEWSSSNNSHCLSSF